MNLSRWARRGPASLARRTALSTAIVCCCTPAAWAQADPTPAAATPEPERITITGNPLGSPDAARPSTVLSGPGLAIRRAGTLGETLDALPGVANTGFGPQSGRPVIRGLDGDRIRLLDGGAASVDASNLSFDHAVAVDPLVAERIEIVRGPAALLYGGNATGGVINSVDNRVPTSPQAGVSGRADLRLGGAARARGGALVLDGGSGEPDGGLAWHADAYGRDTDDLRTPRYTPIADGEALAPTDRVRNSAGRVRGGAVGAGWVDRDGHLGVALDSYRNDYGITAEPDVTIRMRRERLLLGAERRQLGGFVQEVSGHLSQTNYLHEEVEGTGAVGTTFESRGRELRLQAQHAPVGGGTGALRGVFGLQAEDLRFSALGEEAFVPGTRTRSFGVFALEEWRTGTARLSAGLRLERASVNSEGDGPKVAEARFGAPVERTFTPRSLSLGASWPHDPTSPGWSFTVSTGHTERAPAYYELYANGLHIATAAYERGDPSLKVERSQNVEAGAAWAGGGTRVKLNAYVSRFQRFIALDATGAQITVDGEDGPQAVPEYAFSGVPARLWGLEAEARTQWRAGAWLVDARTGLDLTRATNRATGEPLARIAPLRLTAGLAASTGPWRIGADVLHAARQSRVPSTDVATGGYTLLNLQASYSQRVGAGDVLWYARLDNVTDALAFNAVAIGTIRGLAPRGGRALSAGVQVQF